MECQRRNSEKKFRKECIEQFEGGFSCEVLPALANAGESRGVLARNGYRKYSTYCPMRDTSRDRYVFSSLHICRKYVTCLLGKDKENVFPLGIV